MSEHWSIDAWAARNSRDGSGIASGNPMRGAEPLCSGLLPGGRCHRPKSITKAANTSPLLVKMHSLALSTAVAGEERANSVVICTYSGDVMAAARGTDSVGDLQDGAESRGTLAGTEPSGRRCTPQGTGPAAAPSTAVGSTLCLTLPVQSSVRCVNVRNALVF